MIMGTSRCHWLALLTVAGALLGCATTAVSKPDIVWPDAPETARIKFVQSFAQQGDLDSSAGASFLRTLVGSGGEVRIARPMGAAISEDGKRLYIADFGAGSVLVADFEAKSLSRFAPNDAAGMPFSVALDADENVYWSDSSTAQVHAFSRKGERLRSFGQPQHLERPTGIAIDRKRKLLYVADTASKTRNFRVLVFDLDGNHLRDVGGGPGAADGEFNFPTYLAVSGEGLLYVADALNFRVQVFDPEGKFLRKYGEVGDGPGQFARMKGLATDGFGNVYVADGDHEVVQIFNREFQLLMFFGGPANKVEWMSAPSCVAIDPVRNRIYVCQEQFSRINVYDLINTQAEDSVTPP